MQRRAATPTHSGWSLLALGVLMAILCAPDEPWLKLVAIFGVFPVLMLVLGASDVPRGIAGATLRKLSVSPMRSHDVRPGALRMAHVLHDAGGPGDGIGPRGDSSPRRRGARELGGRPIGSTHRSGPGSRSTCAIAFRLLYA